MKLNPPASSSDLEAAREIARRLHQRRRRADFERTGLPSPGPAAAERPAATPFVPASAPQPSAPPAARDRPVPIEARPAPLPPPEPAPPSWDDAGPEEEPSSSHLTGALGDLDDLGGPDPADSSPDPSSVDVSEPADEPEPAETLATGLPGVDVEIEEETVSPDEMVGSAPEEEDAAAEEDPFREALGGDEIDEPSLPPPSESALPGDAEEVFDSPAVPSWDDVVETCRDLAGATGAMIIDPAGQVFAARGAWPDPGPDAIASRLVVMMERTLKDAPTRSVSAPVGGQHLTAWRVPIAEGLLTAAFIADAPLRADVRTAVDAEIHRGAGA
jgi:hypothetical protein